MTDLREALDDYAGLADFVPDPRLVLARVRQVRRRAATRVVGVLGTVLVVATTTYALVSRPDLAEKPGPQTVAGGLAVEMPGLVRPPNAAAAVPLPTDHGVGRASLAYRPCPTCPGYLVLPNGTQYRLDVPLGDVGLEPWARAFAVSLSPDGRWLGRPDVGGGYVLRDLESTRQTRLDLLYPTAWSANGAWLLGVAKEGTAVVSLATGDRTIITGQAFAIADSGQLVSYSADEIFAVAGFARPDGHELRAVYVNAKDWIGRDENLGPRLSSGDLVSQWAEGSLGAANLLLATVFKEPKLTEQPPTVRVGVLLCSTLDGRILRRANLSVGAGMPLLDGGEIIYPRQPMKRQPIDIVKAGDRGETTVLGQLPTEAIFVLPGMTLGDLGPAYRPVR